MNVSDCFEHDVWESQDMQVRRQKDKNRDRRHHHRQKLEQKRTKTNEALSNLSQGALPLTQKETSTMQVRNKPDKTDSRDEGVFVERPRCPSSFSRG